MMLIIQKRPLGIPDGNMISELLFNYDMSTITLSGGVEVSGLHDG